MARNILVAAIVSVIMGVFSVAYRAVVPEADEPPMESAPDDPGLVLFRQQVRQILETRCLGCHHSSKRSGGLDLSTREAALRGGETGEAIVPGSPDESLVIQLVKAGEMPKSGAPLSADEIRALSEWIRLGAPYEMEPLIQRKPEALWGAPSGAMGGVLPATNMGSGMSPQNMGGMMMCPCMQMMQQMMMGGMTQTGAVNGQTTRITRLPFNPRTEEQARQQAEEYLKKLGNPYLKVGKVIETVASWEIQVVTEDGSPVNWLIIDKQRGELRLLY